MNRENRAVLGLLALILASVLLFAQTPATTRSASKPSSNPTSQAVAELIGRLGDDKYAVRNEASKKLTEMGLSIEPLLQAALKDKSLDLEASARIREVLDHMVYSAWPFDAAEAARRQDETARILGVPKELTLELGPKVSMKFVLIPPGRFVMGDGALQHRVTIGKAFYMGQCHVTRGQFEAFVIRSGYKTDADKGGSASTFDGKNWVKVPGASWRKPGFNQTDDHPVVSVSHNDAIAFCDWLSKKTGKTVRLPTEAQWEYAARAGAATMYQWGDDPDKGEGWCNAADQTCDTAKKQWSGGAPFSWDDGYVFTSPVGKFRANAFGLFDMCGNAWQWCADWYDPAFSADSTQPDPQGPESGTMHVLRGSCWDSLPMHCRLGARVSGLSDRHNDHLSFRVICADVESK